MEIVIRNLEDIDRAAADFLAALPDDKRVVAFNGPMGAGKTTFISALCRRLGVSDEVNSPTFSIVNEYHGLSGEKIYHFDFYRLESPEEAMDIGAEDYFYSGDLCLLEWADNVRAILPDDLLEVEIQPQGDGSRKLLF